MREFSTQWFSSMRIRSFSVKNAWFCIDHRFHHRTVWRSCHDDDNNLYDVDTTAGLRPRMRSADEIQKKVQQSIHRYIWNLCVRRQTFAVSEFLNGCSEINIMTATLLPSAWTAHWTRLGWWCWDEVANYLYMCCYDGDQMDISFHTSRIADQVRTWVQACAWA